MAVLFRGIWCLLFSLSLTVILDSPSWARYCNNPYCRMCNRLFGPMYNTPVTYVTATRIDSTPHEAVKVMLEVASLNKDDVLYDPGCGDGRIIEAAVRDYGCQAVGIEIDAGIAASARARLTRSIGSSRWRITTGDATRMDLSGATVACIYQNPELLKKIVPRLRACRRIVSYSHPIMGMTNRRVETSRGPIYVAEPLQYSPPPDPIEYDKGPLRGVSATVVRQARKPATLARPVVRLCRT